MAPISRRVPPGPELQTKIYDFPYPISDLTLKMYTLFQTLWCVANSATLNRFTAYGTSWRPKRCSWFFFFAINVHGSTRYSKNGIPDQIDGIYTLFQTKMAKFIPYFRLEMLENDTPWGGTYLPPPPPPLPRVCGISRNFATNTLLISSLYTWPGQSKRLV